MRKAYKFCNRPEIRDTKRHFMITAVGQKERKPNIRNQKWERQTKLAILAS